METYSKLAVPRDITGCVIVFQEQTKISRAFPFHDQTTMCWMEQLARALVAQLQFDNHPHCFYTFRYGPDMGPIYLKLASSNG